MPTLPTKDRQQKHGPVGQPGPLICTTIAQSQHWGIIQDLSPDIKYQWEDCNTTGYENPKPLHRKGEHIPPPAVILLTLGTGL